MYIHDECISESNRRAVYTMPTTEKVRGKSMVMSHLIHFNRGIAIVFVFYFIYYYYSESNELFNLRLKLTYIDKISQLQQ